MSKRGELWVSGAAPDAAQADSTHWYDGLVQLLNYIPLIELCKVCRNVQVRL